VTNDDPGPIDYLDADHLAPWPRGRSFEGIVAARLDGYPALLNAVGGAGPVAVGSGGAVEAGYAAKVAPAIIGTTDAAAAMDTGVTVPIVAAGDTADNLRVSVGRYLPQPDASLDIAFVSPPLPPLGEGPEPPENRLPPGAEQQGT